MNNINIEIHNIKSISRMNSFIKRLIFSFSSLHKIFVNMNDELLKIENQLNFKSVDAQLIDSYNKMLIFMYDQVLNVLTQTISGQKCIETLVIKPVNIDRHKYNQNLELTYYLSQLVCITKPLGTITNVSINKINDHINILRSENTYNFVLIDTNAIIAENDFRDYLITYENKTKEMIGWFYSDMEYVKTIFRSLLDIILDAIKLSKCEYQQKKWIILMKKIKMTVNTINKCMSEIDI